MSDTTRIYAEAKTEGVLLVIEKLGHFRGETLLAFDEAMSLGESLVQLVASEMEGEPIIEHVVDRRGNPTCGRCRVALPHFTVPEHGKPIWSQKGVGFLIALNDDVPRKLCTEYEMGDSALPAWTRHVASSRLDERGQACQRCGIVLCDGPPFHARGAYVYEIPESGFTLSEPTQGRGTYCAKENAS